MSEFLSKYSIQETVFRSQNETAIQTGFNEKEYVSGKASLLNSDFWILNSVT
jgi:hypothetical protein